MIDLRQACYRIAAHYPNQWPEDSGAEIAFVGRSNVGKSSAINRITDHNGLAKTSKTPGRTQQIVFFDVDEQHRLVDLPGYGYAKAPEHLREHWQRYLNQYLIERQCLKGVVIPMDIRRPFTELDILMFEFCLHYELAIHILLTKSDKLKSGKARSELRRIQKNISQFDNTTVQLFSALNKEGVNEARQMVVGLMQRPSLIRKPAHAT